MNFRSWLDELALWLGGAPKPQTGRTPKIKKYRPGASSTVLREAMSQSSLSDEAKRALDGYRAVLTTMAPESHINYESGSLEKAQHALEKQPIPSSVGAATVLLQELFADCSDVVFRPLLIGGRRPGLLVFTDGLVNTKEMEQQVLDPLLRRRALTGLTGQGKDLRPWLESVATSVSSVEPVERLVQVVDAVLAGQPVLLVDGIPHGVSLSLQGWEKRGIEEPPSEAAIHGPRDGFVETLRTNTAQVRRRVHSPHLKIEQLTIGRRSKTAVALLYMKDLASPSMVEEMRRRLQRVDIDGLTDSGMLEDFIGDTPFSLFPQILNTERPDRVATALLEGRISLIVDGSPFALVVPASFWAFMHANEDYYERFWIGTFLLWLRYVLALLALTGPSLYVALTTYHQEMLPTPLLLSIAAAREGVPFPAVVEVFLMEIFFEALREAGVRLPRPIGQAVSIVGALVIGEAAVRAGLVSAPVVIIVAATGIASFAFPRFSLGIAVRLLRFPMMLLAGSLGFFGVMVGLIAILVHLCSLRSFGVPYLEPVAPLQWSGLKDVLMRAPLWLMGRRPPGIGSINRTRQAPWLKPGPRGEHR